MPVPIDFRALFEESPNSYMLLDRQLRYVAANKAYLRVTGRRLEDLLGRNIFEIFPHDPGDPANESATQLRQSFEKVLATGETDVIAFIRYRVPAASGTEGEVEDRFWSATHTPIREDGRVAFILQHTVDVTELRHLRPAAGQTTAAGPASDLMEAGVLQRAREVQETNTWLELERASRDSLLRELRQRAEFDQQLIGIVSHDLRNPLNAIGVATALLLKRGHLDDQQTRIVTRIRSSSERAVRLIRDFLDFTQARVMGRLPVTPRRASVREIARAVFDEVLLTQPSRKATLEHEGEEHGTWDPDRIAQVIGNLLGNAFQHSPPASVVRLTTRGDEHGVTIEVHNEGSPIPPRDLARLFEPFERGTDASPSGRSIGLGLYIARQVVAAHGGTIDVSSMEQDGTTFRVWLPRGAGETGEPANRRAGELAESREPAGR